LHFFVNNTDLQQWAAYGALPISDKLMVRSQILGQKILSDFIIGPLKVYVSYFFPTKLICCKIDDIWGILGVKLACDAAVAGVLTEADIPAFATVPAVVAGVLIIFLVPLLLLLTQLLPMLLLPSTFLDFQLLFMSLVHGITDVTSSDIHSATGAPRILLLLASLMFEMSVVRCRRCCC
jgi:hypothetical protein